MTRPDSAAHPFAVDPCRRKMLLALSVGTAVPSFAGRAAPGRRRHRRRHVCIESFDCRDRDGRCNAGLGVLFDFDPVRTLLGGIGLVVLPGERLERILRQQLPMPIERFPEPFAAVAVDMEQGEVVALNQGDDVYPPQHSEMSSPLSMLFQSMIVSGWRHALAARALADLVITSEIRTTSQLGLASRAWVTEAGERAAGAQLHEIRPLFVSA